MRQREKRKRAWLQLLQRTLSTRYRGAARIKKNRRKRSCHFFVVLPQARRHARAPQARAPRAARCLASAGGERALCMSGGGACIGEGVSQATFSRWRLKTNSRLTPLSSAPCPAFMIVSVCASASLACAANFRQLPPRCAHHHARARMPSPHQTKNVLKCRRRTLHTSLAASPEYSAIRVPQSRPSTLK